MIIVTIKKLDGGYLDHGKFQSEEKAMEWFQPFIDKGVYGKKESSFEQLVSEEIPAVLDEQGNELSPAVPAVYETIHVPAEFTIEIEEFIDNSVQEKINQEAQRYLDSTDWYVIRFMEEGIPYSEEIKIARQQARDRIIK